MTTIFLRDLEALFGWLLAASWQASVLALLVLGLQWMLRARLNPRWRYALWLLVLARLVLPALPESALSLFQFAPPPPASLVAPVTEQLFVQATLPSPQLDASFSEPTRPFSAYSLLAVIWLLGAVGLLLLTWQVNCRFARQVARSPEIIDPELLESFAAAKKELGIHRTIRLIESGQVQSPAIMGLFQPTLLLPADVRDKFDAQELRFIFLHELAHLKRGDVIAQGLIALLQILHWFNPVLWFAFRRMRIDREPATDALVLSRTGEEEKERYGLMLIKLLEHFNQRHSLPTLVGILEDKDQFKRRFSLIARFTHGAYGWSLLGVLLIGVLAVACLTKSKTAQSVSVANRNTDLAVESYFQQALENDRTFTADSTIKSSTMAADSQMLLAIQKGNTTALKNVLEHAVDPNTFDPDRFHSTPVYWAVHFNQPESLKLLLEHFADPTIGATDDDTPLRLAQRARPDLVPILEEAIKRDRAFMTSRLTTQLHTIHIDLPAFSGVPMHQLVEFLLGATSKAGYLERRVAIGTMDAAKTTITVRPIQDISIWDALQTIVEANNLKFYVDKDCITFYPPADEAAVQQQIEKTNGADKASNADSSSPTINAPMLEAVQKNDVAAVQKLIDQGVDPAKVQNRGTPLIFRMKSPEMAELLLQHGADANARDKSDAILSYVCRGNTGKNGAAIALVLLKHGADPNTCTGGELKVTSLMEARDGATVDALMKYGADPKAVDSEGNNALYYACKNDISALEALIRHGILFDPKKEGPFVLLHATWNDNLALITWLLAHGVDPNSPGIWTRNNGHPEMMLPICATAISGQAQAAKLLLEHGAKGDPAMGIALQNHYNDIVKLLWEHGVRNISELCYAISQGAPPSDLEKNLQSGKPVDPPQDAVITPLGEAAEMENLPAVQLLVRHGADVNKGGNPVPEHPENRDTPLVLAAERGQDEIVTFLLDHGAQSGPSAIENAVHAGIPNSFYVEKDHLPSKEHYERVIQLLIDSGALKNITPEWSGRILAQAMSPCWGDPDPSVLQKLLAAGLSPEVPMPYIEERGEKPNSVIGYFRDYFQKNKDNPNHSSQTSTLRSLLDMLETADKGATSKAGPTSETK